MTRIDEIMEGVYRSQFAASAYEASSGPGTKELEVAMFAADGEVQALITQAIAEARADGAREMREFAAQESRWGPADTVNVVMDREHGGLTFAPAKREPVRLTDGAADAHAKAVMDAAEVARRSYRIGSADSGTRSAVRAIETAVLAANGLTK